MQVQVLNRFRTSLGLFLRQVQGSFRTSSGHIQGFVWDNFETISYKSRISLGQVQVFGVLLRTTLKQDKDKV